MSLIRGSIDRLVGLHAGEKGTEQYAQDDFENPALILAAQASIELLDRRVQAEGLTAAGSLDLPLGAWAIEAVLPDDDIHESSSFMECAYADYIDFVLAAWAIKHRIKAINAPITMHASIISSQLFTDDDREYIRLHKNRLLFR